MTLRRLATSIMDAHANLALEEAIFRLNRGVTVRVWGNERSVIVGRAQLAAYETDLDRCATAGVPVVRRFTAGGAVYNGPGNLNWSLVTERGHEHGPIRFAWDVRGVFRMGASVIVETLRRLGVEARLDEPNRIVTREGKVSGMAAYLSREALLCHGTILLKADLEEAAALTKPRGCEVEKKYVRSRDATMANAGVDGELFIRTLWEVLDEGGEERSPLENPSPQELSLARKLEEKYRDSDWNLGDPFLYGGGGN